MHTAVDILTCLCPNKRDLSAVTRERAAIRSAADGCRTSASGDGAMRPTARRVSSTIIKLAAVAEQMSGVGGGGGGREADGFIRGRV